MIGQPGVVKPQRLEITPALDLRWPRNRLQRDDAKAGRVSHLSLLCFRFLSANSMLWRVQIGALGC